ncbi:MAG TPA: YdeI/OmpD-associated family protein [Ignavibacteriaceae bacterium]|jgi:uncharacterized protein YdeI (YjbR/CyaY-like superfamily)
MEITETLYVQNRNQWRTWLKNNYKTKKEIWLIYYSKRSGKKRIPYEDSVEEALCFGWIDSTMKKLDEDSFAQRFTARNPKSSYSQLNKERLKLLLKQKKVIASVRESLDKIGIEDYQFPKDILNELRKNKTAWKNFQKFPEPYKRIRVAFIDGSRKRPDEFTKRLDYLIKMTEANKKFGLRGNEKYY